jgi:hypothetical protein
LFMVFCGENIVLILFVLFIYLFTYLFIFALCSKEFSRSAYMASSDKMAFNEELERLWKLTDFA